MPQSQKKNRRGNLEINSLERLSSNAFARVAKFTLVRSIVLLATIAVSIFVIIYIANLGGYLDTIVKGQINVSIAGMLRGGWLKGVPADQRDQTIAETRAAMESAAGLDEPYTLRVISWFERGITLNWGETRHPYIISSTYVDGTHTTDVTSTNIRTLILSYLPRTLLLLGVSNLSLFLISIFIALALTRNPGRWIDRVLTAMAPISAAPSWMFGLVLIIIFYRILGIYSLRLGVSSWRTTFTWDFVPIVLKGLLLPFLAIFLSKFFQSIYSWRAFFLTFSNESYIELGKAKGLPAGMLERRYLLRPALPSIITSFALIMISIWQECIAVEYFFNVGGIGSFFVQALQGNEVGVIVALVSLFAYFLAITVFILDIVYALVDPRLRVQGEKESETPYRPGSWLKSVFSVFRSKPSERQESRRFKSTIFAGRSATKKNFILRADFYL